MKAGGEEGGTKDREGLDAVYYFCLRRHFGLCRVMWKNLIWNIG